MAGRLFLQGDVQVSCDARAAVFAQNAALLTFNLALAVLLPALMLLGLVYAKRRGLLSIHESRSAWSAFAIYFHIDFSPDLYYWNVLQIYERLLFVLILRAFKTHPATALICLNCILALYLFLILRLNPYQNTNVLRLDVAAVVSQLVSLQLILVLVTSDFGRLAEVGIYSSGGGVLLFFLILVIAINVGMLAYIVLRLSQQYIAVLALRLMSGRYFGRVFRNFQFFLKSLQRLEQRQKAI